MMNFLAKQKNLANCKHPYFAILFQQIVSAL